MNINGLVSQLNNLFNTGTTQTTMNNEAITDSLKNGMESLLSKNVNSVISGKVISIEGNSLMLALSENEVIKASVEGNANIKNGQLMTFMVSGNSEGDKVSLSPLFSNTATMSTVNHALSEAGLVDDPKMQYMVKCMMDEGLPIDKQSLYDMNRAMNLNDSVDVSTLAKMQRLNIPLTMEMATQFEAYQNLEHELTGAVSNIAESFAEGFATILSNEGTDAAIDFFSQISKVLFSEGTETLGENTDTELQTQTNPVSDKTLGDVTNNFTDKLENLKNIISDAEYLPTQNDKVNDEVNNKEIITADTKDNLPSDTGKTINTQTNKLSNLFSALDDAIKSASTPKQKEVLLHEIKGLLENDAFKDASKKFLVEKFSLSPEDIAKEGSVSKLYEKLDTETKQLLNTLNHLEGKSTGFSESVRNVSSNLEFMNELNQTFNYVQLPIKFDDGNKNGELYVYSNKKSLKDNDGNVSALLHLDMEHLGPLDVHVTLNTENNVKTKFFLNDDASLDLIAEHIDTLNERLNKRGYNMSAEFINNEDDEETSLLDKILSDNKNISSVSSTSFDARA